MPPPGQVAWLNNLSHSDDGLSVVDRAGDAGEATSGPDLLDEVELLRCGGAPVFDLDGGEDRELLPDVLGADGDGGVADEIGTTFAEAVADEATLLVFECSGVVAEEARCATSNSKANSVLNCGLIRTPLTDALAP